MENFLYVVMHLSVLGLAGFAARRAAAPSLAPLARVGWIAGATVFILAVGNAVVLQVNPALAVTAIVAIDEATSAPGAALVAVAIFLVFGAIAVAGVMVLGEETVIYFRRELAAYRESRAAPKVDTKRHADGLDPR